MERGVLAAEGSGDPLADALAELMVGWTMGVDVTDGTISLNCETAVVGAGVVGSGNV